MNRNKIIIVGAFVEVIELAEELNYEIVGLVDDKKYNEYKGYPILLNDSDGSVLDKNYSDYGIVITPDMPIVRNKLFNRYNNAGYGFENLISESSKISKSSTIGNGVIIQHGVNVSSETIIKDFVKLNTNSNVMHNSYVGYFTTIAPNAVVLGNVKIGDNCYIGSNATILPNISICSDVVVGAGAVVVKDITEPGVYAGVPSKKIK